MVEPPKGSLSVEPPKGSLSVEPLPGLAPGGTSGFAP